MLVFRPLSTAGDSALAISQAGVQSAEDAPFITAGYRFLPGDTLHFTFQLVGFRAHTSTGDNPVRSIALKYAAVPEDDRGVALAPPVEDNISVELNPEDKDWSPKRRVSFPLPRLLAAGTYHVRLTAKDLNGQAEVAGDYPFQVGGVALPAGHSLSVTNFEFLRNENDREALLTPAFAPGDAIYMRFLITGFQVGEGNRYQVRCSLQVNRPDGKNFLRDQSQLELDERTFYPAAYAPATLAVSTSREAAKGQYSLTLTVHDLVANKSQVFHSSFSIE